MTILTAILVVVISALCIVAYLIWFFGWRWEVLQFAIILAFAVLGLFAGSAIIPGSRIAEGAAMIATLPVGFVVARWATRKLAEAIDRRSSQARLRD